MSTWRVGRKVGRTIYQDDELIGVMDTPELAEKVVRAVNLAQQSPDDAATADELRAELARLKHNHRIDMDVARRLNEQLRAEVKRGEA